MFVYLIVATTILQIFASRRNSLILYKDFSFLNNLQIFYTAYSARTLSLVRLLGVTLKFHLLISKRITVRLHFNTWQGFLPKVYCYITTNIFNILSPINEHRNYPFVSRRKTELYIQRPMHYYSYCHVASL